MICPNCGNTIEDGVSVCPYCGAKVSQTGEHTDAVTKKKLLAIIASVVAVSTLVTVLMIFKLGTLQNGGGNSTSSVSGGGTTSLVTTEPENDEADSSSISTAFDGESGVESMEGADESDLSSGINKEDDAAPKILLDSTVLLVGDVIPIRFFDGENTYAYNGSLSYNSNSDVVEIDSDESGYRNYVRANSAGETTIVGRMGDMELQKVIHVVSEDDATNGVVSDTEKIVFNVTADGAGADNIKVSVDGKSGDELEARVYTNAGDDLDDNVWVRSSGKWVENVLDLTVSNYLSVDLAGELVVVVTEKNKPSRLVGYVRIPIEIGDKPS